MSSKNARYHAWRAFVRRSMACEPSRYAFARASSSAVGGSARRPAISRSTPAPALRRDRRRRRGEWFPGHWRGIYGQRRIELLDGAEDAGRRNVTTHREDETVRLIDLSVVGNQILA